MKPSPSFTTLTKNTFQKYTEPYRDLNKPQKSRILHNGQKNSTTDKYSGHCI